MSGILKSDPFGHLLSALEPWLAQIVIVGGWAHHLYRLHPHAQRLDYPPLNTLDTDIALPGRFPVGEQDIRSRLLANGFSEEFFGEDRPPATHYHLCGHASGFYAEFLTPLVGGELDRAKGRKATAQIAGIASQRLRFIELLLDHPGPSISILAVS
jgi:Nucleotidyltransferase